MKKILSVLLLILTMLFSGCTNNSEGNELDKVTKYLSNLNSYNLSSTMTIKRNDKQLAINVDVDYLKPNYYKVCFKANDDNEQIIIKNNEGVFVLNPSLNKQFKFDSDWPLNSSHAYLLEAITKDIKEDSNATAVKDDNVIKIECAIQHKTNQNVVKMNYFCDSESLAPKNVCFVDDNGNEVIKVVFNNFIPNKKLTKEYFEAKQYLKNQDEQIPNETTSSINVSSEFNIEGNSLATSSSEDDVTILCYTGEKPYTIIIQEVVTYPEVVVLENYNMVEVLSSGLCLINENCMKYYLNDFEITVYSNNLTIEDYLAIADSISLV